MAEQKWTEQDPAGAITGSEITSFVQSGANKRATLAAVFAALGVTPDQLVDAFADFVAGLPAIEDTPPGTVESVLGVSSGALLVQQNLLDLLGSLQYLQSLTPAADKVPYFTGATGAALADLTAYGRQIIGVANRAALMSLYGLTYADIAGGTSTMPGLGTFFFGDLGASFLAGIPSLKLRTSGAANDGLIVSAVGFSAGNGTTAPTVGLANDGTAPAWRVNDAGVGAGSIRSALNDTSLDAYMRRGEGPALRSSRPTGAVAQSTPRWVTVGNLAVLASGTLFVVGVPLLAGETVASISWATRTTAGSGMTNQWFVLLDPSRVVRAVSADDTSTAWGSNTVKTLAMGTPYVATADGNYYLGVMVAGTTAPTLAGLANATGMLTGLAQILTGSSSTGQTTPPALGATMGAVTAGTLGMPYAYCS